MLSIYGFKDSPHFPFYYGNLEQLKRINNVCIDSRLSNQNSLFLAISGKKIDSHQFFPQLYQKGLRCFILSQEYFSCLDLNAYPDAVILYSINPLEILWALASWYRWQCSETTFVGITGSNGKSTVKELLRFILSETQKKFFVSPHNYNSEYGLPLSILQLKGDENIAVFEVGIDYVGEMEILSSILKPDLALITNIGSAHLEKFKKKDILIEEKKKIFLFMKKNNRAILPKDDKYVKTLCQLSKLIAPDNLPHISFFSSQDLIPSSIESSLMGMTFTYLGVKFFTPIIGEHNISNIAAAFQIAVSLKIEMPVLKKAVAHFRLMSQRQEFLLKKGTLILNDSYNASIESFIAFFNLIQIYLPSYQKINLMVAEEKQIFTIQRKILIMGAIKELGEKNLIAYQKLFSYFSLFDKIFFIDEDIYFLYLSLKKEGKDVVFYPSVLNLKNQIAKEIKKGDFLALKASAKINLTELITVL